MEQVLQLVPRDERQLGKHSAVLASTDWDSKKLPCFFPSTQPVWGKRGAPLELPALRYHSGNRWENGTNQTGLVMVEHVLAKAVYIQLAVSSSYLATCSSSSHDGLSTQTKGSEVLGAWHLTPSSLAVAA